MPPLVTVSVLNVCCVPLVPNTPPVLSATLAGTGVLPPPAKALSFSRLMRPLFDAVSSKLAVDAVVPIITAWPSLFGFTPLKFTVIPLAVSGVTIDEKSPPEALEMVTEPVPSNITPVVFVSVPWSAIQPPLKVVLLFTVM